MTAGTQSGKSARPVSGYKKLQEQHKKQERGWKKLLEEKEKELKVVKKEQASAMQPDRQAQGQCWRRRARINMS